MLYGVTRRACNLLPSNENRQVSCLRGLLLVISKKNTVFVDGPQVCPQLIEIA